MTTEEVLLIKGFSDLEGVGHKINSNAALLIKLGIFQGKGDNIFAPGDVMSRGEAASIICRMLKS